MTARTLAGGIRATAAISPALAGRLAATAFFSTSPRMPVRGADRFTHDAARRDTIEVRGNRVVTYQWGTGTRTALLLHGWVGRASQFATLVRDLVAEGWRVIAFDAPAHGDSAGRRTDVRDWVDAAQRLAASEGPAELIVGHSFGAFAALSAVRSGLDAKRVVTIAGAGTVQAYHNQFGGMLHLTPAVQAAFEAAFHRRLGLTPAQARTRFDALSDPLPDAVELLVVHDEDDQQLDVRHSAELHAAHAGRAHLLITRGLGHNRILGADATLDAVLAFAVNGVAAFSDPAIGSEVRTPR